DPEGDYRALTRESGGRRVDRLHPDSSLLLLKASGRVPHGGGKRLDRASWEYARVREWISQGCERSAGTGIVEKLEITPAEHLFRGPGETLFLRVEAKFSDGARLDITPYCEFRAKDDSIAEITSGGEARSHRPGDTAVIATYRGDIATARLFVPY